MSNRLLKSEVLGSVILIIAVVCFLNSQWSFKDTLEDDAYISFRYARNLLTGNGLVYNPGERVEGYTNLLWVLILSLFGYFGADFEVTAMIGGAFLGVICLLVIGYKFPFKNGASPVDRIANPRSSAYLLRVHPGITGALAAFLTATNVAFQAEAAMGLETVLYTLLVTLAMWTMIHDFNQRLVTIYPAVWIGLAAWTRPEGIWIGAMIILFQAGLVRDNKEQSGKWIRSIAIFGIAILLIQFFRLSYYGEWFPNTFSAKTSAGINQLRRGWGYAIGFFSDFGPITFIMAIAGPFIFFRNRRQAAIPVVWIMLHFFYVIMIGGDYKPSHRFFIPILPTLYLLFLHTVSQFIDFVITRIAHIKVSLKTSALCVVSVIYVVMTIPRYTDVTDFMIASRAKLLIDRACADWLNRNALPGETLATEVAGRIPYFTGMTTFDMSGLNDRHIAKYAIPFDGMLPAGHDRTDAAYIISRNPDYILFHSILVTSHPHPDLRNRNINYFESELWKVPDFHRNYSLHSIQINSATFFNFYKRIPTPTIPITVLRQQFPYSIFNCLFFFIDIS